MVLAAKNAAQTPASSRRPAARLTAGIMNSCEAIV